MDVLCPGHHSNLLSVGKLADQGHSLQFYRMQNTAMTGGHLTVRLIAWSSYILQAANYMAFPHVLLL